MLLFALLFHVQVPPWQIALLKLPVEIELFALCELFALPNVLTGVNVRLKLLVLPGGVVDDCVPLLHATVAEAIAASNTIFKGFLIMYYLHLKYILLSKIIPLNEWLIVYKSFFDVIF